MYHYAWIYQNFDYLCTSLKLYTMKKLMELFNATKVADVCIEMKELYTYNNDLYWKLMQSLNQKDTRQITDYVYPR